MTSQNIRQIEKAIITLDKSASASLLTGDESLLFRFRKAERIVAALYILTGSLSDIEPIKREMRELGSLLIKLILSFRSDKNPESDSIEVSRLIIRLIYLLNLSYIADLLSASHVFILRQELQSLSVLFSDKSVSSEKGNLSDSIFDQSLINLVKGKDSPKGQNSVIKNVHYDAGNKQVKKKRISNGHFSSMMALQEGRKAKIIQTLRDKGPLSIKDISLVFKDCGSKTLQRILVRLVKDGVIMKTGMKRWVRYSLFVKNSA